MASAASPHDSLTASSDLVSLEQVEARIQQLLQENYDLRSIYLHKYIKIMLGNIRYPLLYNTFLFRYLATKQYLHETVICYTD